MINAPLGAKNELEANVIEQLAEERWMRGADGCLYALVDGAYQRIEGLDFDSSECEPDAQTSSESQGDSLSARVMVDPGNLSARVMVDPGNLSARVMVEPGEVTAA